MPPGDPLSSGSPPATPPSSPKAEVAPAPAWSGISAGGRRPMALATWGWLAALVGWTALVSFYHLDGGAGLEPVEAWVAQPAREMYENIAAMWAAKEEAGWQWRPLVIPEFCGEARLQKSPGAYWAVCLASYLRGGPVDEVAARIPNAIGAVLLVLTIFWLTRRIAGDRAAIFAGFAAASSAMVLYWSHGAASDLGVATLITMSLACLWVGSEDEPPGWRRTALWLLGYLFAGVAMIYKMPLPVVCIGLPALLYVLVRNRWKVFASWWHLLGLALFLLPWLPWALAAGHFEPMALAKWRVEYFDRVTGELPNVDGQKTWYWYLFYLGVALLLSVPYSLSVPKAIARAFRRRPDVNRDGLIFMLIWFASLLVFLTLAVGKETRYFLAAMPPLFVLVGVELAAFFDPDRPYQPKRRKRGFTAICVLVPAVLVCAGFLLHHVFWKEHLAQGICTWPEIFWPFVVAAVVFAGGMIFAAWFYQRRREHASFAALVGTMWVAWLWIWPQLLSVAASQAPFKDFAGQLQELRPEQQARLRHVAHQDPRIIWYSDVRYPRIVDQLDMLAATEGTRDLSRVIPMLLDKVVQQLSDAEPALLVGSSRHYAQLLADARLYLESQGRTLPETYVWIAARKGRWDRRYVLFSNQRPPWEEPVLLPGFHAEVDRRRKTLQSGKRRPFDLPTMRPATSSGG